MTQRECYFPSTFMQLILTDKEMKVSKLVYDHQAFAGK